MDYTIRDLPNPKVIISNEDFQKLKENRPKDLKVALIQREFLINKLEDVLEKQASLSAKFDKVSSILYGYYDCWGSFKNEDGALDLLKEVVDSELTRTCKSECKHNPFAKHSTKECLETRITEFLKQVDD